MKTIFAEMVAKKIYIRKTVNDDYVMQKKLYVDGVQTYSAGNNVTYYVDTNTVYTEEVEFDKSCLNPTSFTPSKSGYTFVGWREDTTANGNVLTDKVMGDNEVTLYAVFQKTITLTTRISGASSTHTGYQYYNNGNIVNPTFTVANPTKSGASFLGWSTASTSTTVSYSTISNRTFTANTTVYAVFKYADATVSPTTVNPWEEVFFSGTQNRATIYSSVDTSKYYAATLTLAYASSRTDYTEARTDVYVSDGTNNALVVNSYVVSGGTKYESQNTNLKPTLTFSTSSGTKPIYLRTKVTNYYTGASADTRGYYNVYVSSIKLLGRTVVG